MDGIKKALVTGASRGIGRAIAERLAEEGISLVLVCRENDRLLKDQAAVYRERYGISCRVYRGDVSDPGLAEEIFFREKDIDLLINNAGIAYVGLFHEMTDPDYHRVMGVNLDGVFYFSRAASREMLKAHGGQIINITSVWGEVGASMEVVYSAAKAGVIGMTKGLAKELAPSHIRVNAISCGMIDTDMNSCFSEEDRQAVVDEIPADRMGRAEEVAELVIHLIKGPDYLTGQVIRMDGGWI